VKKGLLEEYLQEIEQKYEESQKMLSNAQYELKMLKESENKFVVEFFLFWRFQYSLIGSFC